YIQPYLLPFPLQVFCYVKIRCRSAHLYLWVVITYFFFVGSYQLTSFYRVEIIAFAAKASKPSWYHTARCGGTHTITQVHDHFGTVKTIVHGLADSFIFYGLISA